jgi:hypothetical protein
MTDAFRMYESKSCRIIRRFNSDPLWLAVEA